MDNPFADAEYLPLPELSPYVAGDRYENPKEVFKHIVRKLKKITEPDKTYRYADIACANGELLYLLKKEFPHWSLHGFDFTPQFIECGRAFPGLEGVQLNVADFYDLEERFDIVSFVGMMHGMWDPEKPLNKLLELCNDNGFLLIDGCFNPYEVEFRAVFMDNSKPEAEGKWRRDFSQHSRTGIAKLLKGRCVDLDFEDIVMGVDLPRKPDAPHVNVWTFKDEHGRRIVTNGTQMMLNKTLLTVCT